MRLQILSDLHLETRGARWRALVEQIPAGAADALVLAGDVLCVAREEEAAAMLAALRPKAPRVLLVLGNHEHYFGRFGDTAARAAALCAAQGVELLEGGVAEVAGRRVLGTTLWFPHDPAAAARRAYMNDFRLIADFEPAVYEANGRALAFLRAEVRPGDVVVTHHLPSPRSVAPPYRAGPASALNPFFLCDCEALIGDKRPALWIHGHTHTPFDYALGETRVVCNPIGYPGERGGGRLDLVVEA